MKTIPTLATGTVIPGGTKSLEQQIKEAKETQQLEEFKRIADGISIQADIAIKQSKKADIKGWIAIIISIFCAFIELAVHYEEIISFIKMLLEK